MSRLRSYTGHLSCFVTLVAVTLLTCSTARAQSGNDDNLLYEAEWKRGYHGLAMLCRSNGLELAEDLREFHSVPRDRGVLLVLGEVEHYTGYIREHLRLGGAVLVASDRNDNSRLIDFQIRMLPGPVRTRDPEDRYQGYSDCPRITDLSQDHPVTRGVNELVVNRGGLLLLMPETRRRNAMRWDSLAKYPHVQPAVRVSRRTTYFTFDFAAATENSIGGRIVCISDQSLLSNQMLLLGDNALFANNALNWLSEGGRTHVMIVSDYDTMQPFSPDELDVTFPPPTPAQLRNALRKLPPEALLEFGNAVTRILEDEGVANELSSLMFSESAMNQRRFNRYLLVIVTTVLVLFLLYRTLSYGRGSREPRQMFAWLPNLRISPRRAAARDRRRAAETAIGQLILDFTQDTDLAWNEFQRRLKVGNQLPETRRIRRQLRWIQRQVTLGKWSPSQLLRLESDLNSLRQLRQAGLLVIDGDRPPVVTPTVAG